MSQTQWAEPALLWGTRPMNDRQKPQLLELKSDDFLPEFLAAMQAKPDKALRSNPEAIGYINTARMSGSTLKLYQPLHNRYYLVTASLVCHQVGLPDKQVNLKQGEKTSFVIRRTQNGLEQGWSDVRGWVTVSAHDIAPDEERFPMHPVSVCTGKEGGIVPCERKIYYGYVSTGNREKYLDKQTINLPITSKPEEKIKQFFAEANQTAPADQQIDPRFDEFDTRVIASWDFLILRWKFFSGQSGGASPKDVATIQAGSLNILLDFADYLDRTLPTIREAIKVNSSNGLINDQLALYQFLETTNIVRNNIIFSLKDALRELAPSIGIVHGEDIVFPTTQYNLSGKDKAFLDTLKDKMSSALAEETSLMKFGTPADAEERVSLIENQVRPVLTNSPNPTYFLRIVYEYDPECPPVISEQSSPFTFARFFEPDAPARMVRIEMPSIRPADLRKFRHGVGMQMSPELRRVMDGVHDGLLNKEGLKDAVDWELGMICTFSIQIITLIAFVVMFIFAIALNIVFWWLAFIKICLPIPKKA